MYHTTSPSFFTEYISCCEILYYWTRSIRLCITEAKVIPIHHFISLLIFTLFFFGQYFERSGIDPSQIFVWRLDIIPSTPFFPHDHFMSHQSLCGYFATVPGKGTNIAYGYIDQCPPYGLHQREGIKVQPG